MPDSLSLIAHVAVGGLALLTFWLALTAPKGGPRHRGAGRVFFVAMLAVVASVGPLLVAEAPVEPGRVIQLVYLSTCVLTVVGLAWGSARWRRSPERFLRLPLRAMGAVLVGLGGLVLLAGLGTANPVAAVLSWVGLAFGSGMWRFARAEGPLPARWWLRWHLDAICGLLTAVHGTLSFVAWRALVAPEAGPATAACMHLGVLGLALVARAWLSRRSQVPSFVFPWTSAGPALRPALPPRAPRGSAAPRG